MDCVSVNRLTHGSEARLALLAPGVAAYSGLVSPQVGDAQAVSGVRSVCR